MVDNTSAVKVDKRLTLANDNNFGMDQLQAIGGHTSIGLPANPLALALGSVNTEQP